MAVTRWYTLLIAAGIIIAVIAVCSCNSTVSDNKPDGPVSEKISSQLLVQVSLKKEQLTDPNPERLEQMRNMGMNTGNLEVQRIFIHLEQKPNTSQINELQTLGLTLYLDSWIPPVGSHPTGFILADMPVNRLEELAEKDYVIRLDTAESVLEPQNGFGPDVE